MANTSWNALLRERILAPLGMATTRSSLKEAWNDPRMARGYWGDETGQRLRPVTLDTIGINVDGVAPAGAISSTARDMTLWLRFLLRQGVHDGKALISPAALSTTWTPQIPIGDANAYGMGWFVRSWQGHRLIEHGGAFAGYSAEVGLLPDSNLGFVVLTNTLSALPSIATQMVPQYLLGELPPSASEVPDLKPYVGRYVANVASFSNEIFTISERNGRLVLDIPSQLESALSPPHADGRWPLVTNDRLAVSFNRTSTGQIVGLKLHQAGQEFEVPREGVVIQPEIPLRELQKYVGRYSDAKGALEFGILVRNQRLAVTLPNNTSFDLLPPDTAGRWAARANPRLAVSFETSPSGTVAAMNLHRPGATPVMRLTPMASALPTVAEIIQLRRVSTASTTVSRRTTGVLRVPQSGIVGRFSSTIAGDDHLRIDLEFDAALRVRTVLNQRRASQAMSGGTTRNLTEKEVAQARLGHPAVIFGDWRNYYDTVRVMRAGELGGKKIYVVQLESAGLPPALMSVDAETGDLLQTQQTIRSAEAGMPGAVPITTTYSDYREVGGVRLPYRYVESIDMAGRIVYEVERVELDAAILPDVFTLSTPTGADQPK